jgi:hypothetical protein
MSFAISIAVSGLASYAAGRAWGSREWWRSTAAAQAIGAGAALAVASIAIVAVLPSTWHRAAFATLLLGISTEYTGFAIIDRRPGRIAVEAAWAAGTMAAAIAGVLGSPAWLAAGFIAHVGWDLMHHNGINRVDTHAVPGWHASACIAYDLPVGIAALVLS